MTRTAMPDRKSSTIDRVFVEEVVAKFGLPSALLTNNGTNICGHVQSIGN